MSEGESLRRMSREMHTDTVRQAFWKGARRGIGHGGFFGGLMGFLLTVWLMPDNVILQVLCVIACWFGVLVVWQEDGPTREARRTP